MGQEAHCLCECEGSAAPARATLEARELFLRGGFKDKIPFAAMTEVRSEGERLRFQSNNQSWSLTLGKDVAAKWASIILAPPPSLAKKLGITRETNVEVIGAVEDEALEEALSGAKSRNRRNAELIIACVDTREALACVLKEKSEALGKNTPVWVVYRKGRGQLLGESDVRALCLAAGLVDSKVTAVSAILTALRFVKRRAPAKGRA